MPSPRRLAWNCGVAAVVFGVLTLLAAACAHRSTRLEDDQFKFNLPTILQFSRQLPYPNLRDYPTATSPGYHLVLAVVARLGGENLHVLRVCGSVFGLLLIATMTAAVGGRLLLVLPLALSAYVVTSAAWLLPEDAAWWLAVAVVGLALCSKINLRFFVAGSILLTTLVFTRQSALWVVAPFAAAAWFGESELPRAKRLIGLAVAVVPPLVVLGWLVWMWHGLTPPAFQLSASADNPALTRYGGISPGSAMMTLTLIGLYGVPLLPWFLRGRASLNWLIVGALVGLAIGLICPSQPMFPTRRSGIWSFVGHAPIVANRSVVMALLSILGGVVSAAAISAAPRRPAWVVAALLIGFIAVQTTNPFLWQRYYEPFALIWLIFAAAAARPILPPWMRAAGLWTLIAMQSAAFVYFLFFSSVS